MVLNIASGMKKKNKERHWCDGVHEALYKRASLIKESLGGRHALVRGTSIRTLAAPVPWRCDVAGTLLVADGDADWCGHCGRRFPTKLNILLPYDAGIAALGIYPKELKTYVHTQFCT